MAATGEPVPLYDGRTVELEVVGHGADGLLVKTDDGVRRLRWDQVARSYPRHPLHGVKLPYELAESGERSADEIWGEIGNGVEESGSRDVFFWVLLFVFGVFWVHVFAVWLVGRQQLFEGRALRAANLGVLVFGLPLAFFLIIRRRGFRGVLTGEAGLLRRGRGAPACRFHTWDNVPLTPKSSRKLSSGLAVAEMIMSRAVKAGASDVHLDTAPQGVKVAFRVDGVLRSPDLLALDVGKRVMSAIKMAAGMDVAKIQEAQDGACHLQAGEAWYDLRVARAWAVNGETLVVRLLHTGGHGRNLAEFGMFPPMVAAAEKLAFESSGIVIMAGPTGSGKTTTIYAMLRRIEGTGRNILTIEDPVEYRLDQATQISLNTRQGATFASALKTSMRHDPDVILVGEIRDAEAMDVAFQAALTGHLVFTTLHATSLLATFGRLKELGLSAYMINTGLRAIVCQRLIKVLCPSCRESYLPEPAEVEFWGLTPVAGAPPCLFYRPVGCRLCDGSGYHGRRGVYRMLCVDNRVRALVRDDLEVGELQDIIDRMALGSITDHARELLATGVTSPDELRRTLDMFDYGKRLGGHHAD